ncbi:MAG: PQQ-binding-like beta-propeller repeat protein [Pirellulales bacterium]
MSLGSLDAGRSSRRACVRFLGLLSLAVACVCGAAPLGLQGAEPWTQFRGPAGDGSSRATGLPTQWSETEHVRWKTPLHGKAWSSPVIWGSQIWLTTATPDGKQLSVMCVDADSGKVLRDQMVFEIEKPQFCIERNSYASSTPVIEEGRLYVHFGSAGTACLDTETGKTIWARQDLPCDHHRGPASSPVLWGDLLFLTFDGFDVQYVAALDKKTGQTVWKTDRNIEYGSDNGDIKKAYSTPHLIEVNGQPQLVDPSAGAAIAYDPKTGAELWRVRGGGMNASARPLFAHGLVYISTADGGFKFFAAKPDGRGDVTQSHVAWKQTKGIPKYSSPCLVGDLLFTSAENGVLSCLDAKTGEVVWQERVGGSFTASPITAEGRVYFSNEDGDTFVVAAARKYELAGRGKLEQGCMASLAVYDKSLIIRTTKNLYRIDP